MKKLFLTSLLLFVCIISFQQQWTGSQTVNGNLSRTGNVGIGIATPISALHVIGALQASTSSGATNNGIVINGGNTTTPASTNVNRLKFGGSDVNANYFSIQGPNNFDYLTINGGNIGIGTTSPVDKLHVIGSMSANTSTSGVSNGIIINGGNTNNANSTNVNRLRFGGSDANSNYFTIQGPSNADYLTINGGNILIGKTSQVNNTYKLDVNGNVRANKIVVNTTGADFVFEPTYKLLSLASVETYINQHKHLPGINSATQMQNNGLDVGEMNTKLLQKVEELTMYIISQNKQIQELQRKVLQIEKNDDGKKNK